MKTGIYFMMVVFGLSGCHGSVDIIPACARGDVVQVSEFVNGRGNVNSTYDDGWTPLAIASKNGHLEVVRILLQNHAQPDLEESGGNGPLFWAAREGHKEIVAILLSFGAKVQPLNEKSGDPLYVAVSRKRYAIIQILMKHGANPDRKTYEKRSARELAKENRDNQATQLLSQTDEPK